MLTQGGRARTPAPLIGEKWGVTMPVHQNVSSAMQFIRVATEEIRVTLASSKDLGFGLTGSAESQSNVILDSILEVTNDYPQITVTKTNVQKAREDHLGEC